MLNESERSLKDKKFTARFFAVSLGTVDRWVSQGRGPRYIKVGNLVRFRMEDLVAFADANVHGGEQLGPIGGRFGVRA
jgi:predicted DNA-binding transcriptional regulator AlpA